MLEPASKVSHLFSRFFAKDVIHPFESITWVRKDAVIIGGDGKEKFRQNNVEVPSTWTDNQIGLVAEKYFRVINGVKEDSAKQMFHRVAHFIAEHGVTQGVLLAEEKESFYCELLYLLVNGMFAFNSPVWFNVGVQEHPQCSACFIQNVNDTMEGILDLSHKEVMLFKGGSGTGSNLSPIRSSYEVLTGGGYASGPVSFMKPLDSFAGVTKSGGTTRRAAKMVVLNVNHPDIFQQRNGEAGFITCKADAEDVAHALYSTGRYTAEWNKPGNVYDRVGFQNANNSVRVTDEYMQAVLDDGEVQTKTRDGKVVHTYKAKFLWDEIAKATHRCGDPGLQFDTITNDWHTCKASGRINASNPCSEYLFLDDTACNLGSLNLFHFAQGKKFDVEAFKQAVDITITAMEILVDASSYPSGKIAQNSHKYRTLGLGYTNLGALLTYWGLPYDSNEGRSVAAAITSVMGGQAYTQSARIAARVAAFPGYDESDGTKDNGEYMAEVMKKHHAAAKHIPSILDSTWDVLFEAAIDVWRDAIELGRHFGYRNAQVTVIAPTGTISFLMGADTTGVEPMLGIIQYKKLVGGGVIKIVNNIVPLALRNLGYTEEQTEAICAYVNLNGTIDGAPHFQERHRPVFAEALGDNAIAPEAHIDMMAAIQPFLSGGISKTVNMPAETTSEEIAKIYMRAWKKGLKCVAIYRDGCKLSQPIATTMTDTSAKTNMVAWGERKRLSDTRKSVTHKFNIGGQEGYLHVGLYEDGKPGEIFLNVSKAGSTLHGFLDAWATTLSIGLQHGVPLATFKEKFLDVSFPPSGFSEMGLVKSIPDYIFKWLERQFPEASGAEIVPDHVPEVQSAPVSTKKPDKKKGYDGPPCTRCGNFTQRAGSCYVCSSCGTTSGCS